MSEPTQYDRILADLRAARPEPVCGTRWLQAFMPRYASPICQMRKEGYVIDGRRCSIHAHKGPVFMYWLVREADDQMKYEQTAWLF